MNQRKNISVLQKIRESFVTKVVAVTMVQSLIFPLVPNLKANTGPVDTNYGGGSGGELVDMSSGSFNYSIPLMDVGGFPIQLSYDANVTMDQQASMVGLGWNLNLGAINRTVRGIPDDFNGDEIKTTMNLRPRLTINNSFSPSVETVGVDLLGDLDVIAGAGINLGFTFNNYTGNENSIGVNGSVGVTKDTAVAGPSAFLSGGASSSSRSGLSSNLGVSLALGKADQFKTSLGINKNSLYGSSLNFGFGYSKNVDLKGKDKKVTSRSYGSNVSGSYPLGMKSYTPTATFEFQNKSWTIDVAAGGLVYAGIDLHGSYSRTKSTVCLKENERSQKAYGYMNQENGYGNDALQDFNLSLPQVHENVAGLPTPMPTNDYFVSPSGTFRAVRNDAGYVKNPTTKSNGYAASVSGDAAIGPGFELGVNLSYNWNNTTSGNWEGNNPFNDDGIFEFGSDLPFGDAETKAKYETFSLIKVNSRSSVAATQYDGIRKETALRQQIYKSTEEIKAHNYMVTDDGSPDYPVTSNTYYQAERRDRNEVLEYLSNKELRLHGDNSFDKYAYNNFEFNGGDYQFIGSKLRSEENYPDDHIGQLTVIGGGGSREVYGLPVMNESDQVSFNISAINNAGHPAPIVDDQGLVSYVNDGANADNSINNKRGDDHFYLKNHVPKHATSYLLTEQLSSNYVDRTGNGPTPDDYGNYTKFNYVHTEVKKWRFPYQKNKATFDEGFKSNTLDDKGSYAYGERDDWYVHSIETKDYIAEFVYSNRLDARGVNDENGGPGGADQVAKKLDQIKLFTRKAKEYDGSNAIPIKTAHFVYDNGEVDEGYLLCNGVPDNTDGKGKLTLKEVYFTGYNSLQGALNKYKFTYGSNFAYDLGKTDRWGNYQHSDAPINFDALSALDNAEYPYTNQNKDLADIDARAWKLNKIDLPIGSRIEIDYEANDYEYIQDVEATNMYKISGFYSTEVDPSDFIPTSGFSANLYDPDNSDEEHFYIRVDLDESISGTSSQARTTFANHFLPARKSVETPRYLYYNALLNLAPHNSGVLDPDVYEYIQGYAEIIEDAWYLLGSEIDGWNQVVYRVKPERLNETKASSPIMQAMSRKADQFIKETSPLVLYPENDLQAIYAKDGSINCGDDAELEDGETNPDLGDDSKNHKKNIMSRKSVYHMMKKTGYASRAVLPKCWVRMRSGLTSKVGGGARVKAIKTFDNWNDFVAGENSSVYGTKYEYTTTNERGELISSGVTSYETLNGGDEIALREPHFYVHTQKGTPSEKFYTEFPLNEQIFASAQVRYAEIKSSSIDYDGLEINTPGYTVHRNFTAKDYPIRFDYTNPLTLKSPAVASLIGIRKSRFGAAFGTSILTNNMHGVFKGKEVRGAKAPEDEGPDPLIYRMEHRYHEDGSGELVNKVPTINPDGSRDDDRIIGQTTDLITFLSKNESNSSTVNLKMNFEFAAPFAVVPSAWPSGNTSENTIYTSLTTKVIYQTGLLQEVMVEDNGRAKYVENLLYDAQSGSAITTKVTPEKGDGIQYLYEYNYPAHWAYDGLGLTSDNAGIRRLNITGTGTTILPSEKTYFYPGDELIVFYYPTVASLSPTTTLVNHWVVENETTGDYFLADRDGNIFDPVPGRKYEFKVQHPGKKNQLGASMASVSSLQGFIEGTSPYDPTHNHTDVINLSGLDFFQDAKMHENDCVNLDDEINPYTYNLRGQWKAQNSYVFDGDRDYTSGDCRKDGLLTTYQPFWKNVAGTWQKNDDLAEWIKTATATIFDEYGYGLESKNALNVYNSQDIGYNNQVGKNSTMNARYAEAGFDGFEDYFVDGIVVPEVEPNFIPYGCTPRHFDWGESGFISEEEAHTGNYSLFVDGPNYGGFNPTTWDGVAPLEVLHGEPFKVEEADVIPPFRLVNDQEENKYILTVWVKEKNTLGAVNYDAAGITISVGEDIIERRSNIIDGWQRIELIFNVPPPPEVPNNTAVYFKLKSTNTTGVYYDDLRIQPYDSDMQSVVIDAFHRRSDAKLDGRDFSTSYQYDENGSMVRVIQETELGTQTIKENRSGFKINH